MLPNLGCRAKVKEGCVEIDEHGSKSRLWNLSFCAEQGTECNRLKRTDEKCRKDIPFDRKASILGFGVLQKIERTHTVFSRTQAQNRTPKTKS